MRSRIPYYLPDSIKNLIKSRLSHKDSLIFRYFFLQYFPRIWVDRNTGVFLARESHGGDLTPRIIFDGLCMARA